LFSNILLVLIVSGQALAYNPTLLSVGEKRQTEDLVRTIPDDVDIAGYECRVAVQYPYNFLVGREVFFRDDSTGEIHGPWLVTDYQHPTHYYHGPKMSDDNLLADVDCKEFVHRRGRLYYKPVLEVRPCWRPVNWPDNETLIVFNGIHHMP